MFAPCIAFYVKPSVVYIADFCGRHRTDRFFDRAFHKGRMGYDNGASRNSAFALLFADLGMTPSVLIVFSFVLFYGLLSAVVLNR